MTPYAFLDSEGTHTVPPTTVGALELLHSEPLPRTRIEAES